MSKKIKLDKSTKTLSEGEAKIFFVGSGTHKKESQKKKIPFPSAGRVLNQVWIQESTINHYFIYYTIYYKIWHFWERKL